MTLSVHSEETKHWTSLLTDKPYGRLHRKLKGQENLEWLNVCPLWKHAIKDINMFNLFSVQPKLYECCWCSGVDAGMWRTVKTDGELHHQGAADWLWPPAKRYLIGCWPIKERAHLLAGFGPITLIAKDWNTDISNQWLKDTLGCLQLIWLHLYHCGVWCAHVYLSKTLGLRYELNAKIHLLLLKLQIVASAEKSVTPPHWDTVGCPVCQD